MRNLFVKSRGEIVHRELVFMFVIVGAHDLYAEVMNVALVFVPVESGALYYPRIVERYCCNSSFRREKKKSLIVRVWFEGV